MLVANRTWDCLPRTVGMARSPQGIISLLLSRRCRQQHRRSSLPEAGSEPGSHSGFGIGLRWRTPGSAGLPRHKHSNATTSISERCHRCRHSSYCFPSVPTARRTRYRERAAASACLFGNSNSAFRSSPLDFRVINRVAQCCRCFIEQRTCGASDLIGIAKEQFRSR